MNRACTIKAHQGGLFSLVNNVLTCMERYEHVHVDWSNSLYGAEDLYPKLFGRTNPESFYRPCPGYPMVPIPRDTILDYPDKWLTYTNPHKLYTGYQSWRNRMHPYWWRMGVLPHFTEFAESFARVNFGAFNIGVLIRANTHAGEQINGISQTLHDYMGWMDALEKRHPHAKFYVMCQDEDSIDRLHQCYGNIITHPGVKRSATRDIDRHLHEPQTHEDAFVCLEEMLILSKCDVLIHPISNIATAALIANPALRSVYLE